MKIERGLMQYRYLDIPNDAEWGVLMAGVMFMLMNLENNFRITNHTKRHMKEMNNDLEHRVDDVEPFYAYCKEVYRELGKDGLIMVLNKQLPFPIRIKINGKR